MRGKTNKTVSIGNWSLSINGRATLEPPNRRRSSFVYVETAVEIDASPERVWEVMTDIERWPEWTASVERVERLDDGPLRLGSRARLKQPRFPSVVWEVTDLERGRSFTWTARNVGVTSIGAHRIVPGATGRVTVNLSLRQEGPVAPVLALFTGKLTRRYIQTEAQGLKRRCEA